MADKSKGKSYWPFKKPKLDLNTTSNRNEEIASSTYDYSDTGGKNSSRTEEASYGSSGRGGSGESTGMSSMGKAKNEAVDGPRPEGRQYGTSDILDIQDVAMQDPPPTKYSRDTVEQRYEKTLEEDPQSYSLSVVTVQQQAAQESNFIGSAYFYNLNLFQVQDTLGGDYLIVYARPKTSNSYPRGSAAEVFDPNFRFRRFEIHTEVPEKGHPDERRTKHYLSKGYWAYGTLHFNGIQLSLCFDGPATGRKDQAQVFIETLQDAEDPTGVFEKTVNYGCYPRGSSARFGVKEMFYEPFYESHVQYGFQFIELTLSVINQITGLKDFHHVVAVKLEEKKDVSSSFLLKQPITMPHFSWVKFQKLVTRDLNKPDDMMADVEYEARSWEGFQSY